MSGDVAAPAVIVQLPNGQLSPPNPVLTPQLRDTINGVTSTNGVNSVNTVGGVPGVAVTSGSFPPAAPIAPAASKMQNVQETAEIQSSRGYGSTSYLFGVGLFLFIIAVIFIFLLPSCWIGIAYVVMALGFILMLAGAFTYCLSAPDRYCSRNPSDAMCIARYSQV